MTPGIRSARPALTARRRIPGPPHDPVKARLLRLYRDLSRRFGAQHWWPGRSAFEIAVGAILTQHTAWTSAARAVASLRGRRLLTPARLAAVPEPELAALIRAAGTYRLKARRLRAFTAWLLDRHGGRFDGLRRSPLAPLRRELLGVSGLGPETVDAILLYAAHRPTFVADAYARRVLERHGLVRPGIGYEDARVFVESHLPSDPALFNEFHALLVAAAKAHCRAVPICATCPLRGDLIYWGPRHGRSS
jgi:endonuclease-3 related protein